MKDLGHGANVDNMAKKFGKNENDIIDFSSNVNPHIISDLGKYVLEGLEKSTYEKYKKEISYFKPYFF